MANGQFDADDEYQQNHPWERGLKFGKPNRSSAHQSEEVFPSLPTSRENERLHAYANHSESLSKPMRKSGRLYAGCEGNIFED